MEQVELAVEADRPAGRAPHGAAVDLHLRRRPHLADILPAPVVGVVDRAAGAVPLLQQDALGQQVFGQALGQARLEGRLPRLEVAPQVGVLGLGRPLVGVGGVPCQEAVVGHAGHGLGHGHGRGRHERDVVALAVVAAVQVRVDVGQQEAHGLLGGDGGCAHEGHVQVVAHAQAREVCGGDALVQGVVHGSAADLSRQDGGDALPAVLADLALAVVFGVVERRLRVSARGLVDDLVRGSADCQDLRLCHVFPFL